MARPIVEVNNRKYVVEQLDFGDLNDIADVTNVTNPRTGEAVTKIGTMRIMTMLKALQPKGHSHEITERELRSLSPVEGYRIYDIVNGAQETLPLPQLPDSSSPTERDETLRSDE